MNYEQLRLKGLILITPDLHRDDRGYFYEVLRKKVLKDIGIEHELVQVNQSYSKRDVIRGLHFQKKPFEQGKLVRVAEGKIMDVVVDIRPESETFLQWHCVTLTSEQPQMLWIPRGFAHGFRVLSESAIVEYHCDEYYYSEHDSGILYNDGEIGIDWEISQPIVSEKDRKLPTVRELFPELEVRP
jgi:dTDP-4-dehydrorhamnose 3,5-epimerase